MTGGAAGPSLSSSFVRACALDLRSLALFRVGVALVLLLDLFTRAVDVEFLSDRGVLPRGLWFDLNTSSEIWSLHTAIGSEEGVLAMLAGQAALALALLVGWRTRWVTVASWLLLVSLQNRNLVVSYGADLMLRVSLLWGCLLPWGARFSVDARRTAATATRWFGLAGVGLIAQLFVVYFFSALQKLHSPEWRSLDAVGEALAIDHHATALATWLAPSDWFTRPASFLLLLVELFGPLLLLFPRTRGWGALLFTLFHIATALFFHIGLFPLIGMVCQLGMIPPALWRARASPVTDDIDVDGHRGRTLLAAAVFTTLVLYNVHSLRHRYQPDVLRLDQTWNMFRGTMKDGWFIAPVSLDDGTTVDAMTGGAVTFDKPADVSDQFKSMRWRKYMTTLMRPTAAPHRRAYARWLCRTYRQQRAAAAVRPVHAELWMVEEATDGTTSRVRLARVSCDNAGGGPPPAPRGFSRPN